MELRKTAGRAEPTERLGSKPCVKTAVSGLSGAGGFLVAVDKVERHTSDLSVALETMNHCGKTVSKLRICSYLAVKDPCGCQGGVASGVFL